MSCEVDEHDCLIKSPSTCTDGLTWRKTSTRSLGPGGAGSSPDDRSCFASHLGQYQQTVLIMEARRRDVHTLALILDNGPTHAPKRLARGPHELTTILKGKLVLQVYWLPKNASWLDQIEIWFSLLQHKLLQPNHFTSTDELQQVILDFIAHYNQTAQPLKWSYTVEQLEHKLGMNL
jgi:hypothetical protein